VPGLGQRHVLDGAVGAVAGAVDQDVDPALFGEDALDSGLHGFLVGDIHRQGADARGGEVIHAFCSPGRGVGGVAEFSQFQGSGFADAGRAAGDEGDLAGHRLLLFPVLFHARAGAGRTDATTGPAPGH